MVVSEEIAIHQGILRGIVNGVPLLINENIKTVVIVVVVFFFPTDSAYHDNYTKIIT